MRHVYRQFASLIRHWQVWYAHGRVQRCRIFDPIILFVEVGLAGRDRAAKYNLFVCPQKLQEYLPVLTNNGIDHFSSMSVSGSLGTYAAK